MGLFVSSPGSAALPAVLQALVDNTGTVDFSGVTVSLGPTTIVIDTTGPTAPLTVQATNGDFASALIHLTMPGGEVFLGSNGSVLTVTDETGVAAGVSSLISAVAWTSSDPHVNGQLWKSSGTPIISAG